MGQFTSDVLPQYYNLKCSSLHPDDYKKGTSMQKSQAISAAKSAGNLAFRFINYWLLEPAANIGKPVFRSVRYFTFVGVFVATLLGYKYPETTKSFIKSCLPKITVEAPEIFKD